jgi:hypothetical protein
MARRTKSLVSALVYLVFLAVFVEVALQAFYYFTAGGFLFSRVGRPMYAVNPYSGFWNKPDLRMEHNTSEFQTMLHTNREGFRVSAAHEEYAIPKDPAKLRAMLLGPSFAFGWGVDQEQTFGVRLEALLEDAGYAGGRDVEIINAGVPSLGPAAGLRWYRHRGREFAPDLVIQFIYGSMAIDTRADERYSVNGEGYLVPRRIDPSRKLQHTLKQSAIVFYGWVMATRVRALLGAEEPSEGVQGAGRELAAQQRFDPERPALRGAIDFYDELRSAVEEGGARLLVVYFPLSYAIHPEDVSRWRHLGVRDGEAQRRFDDDFCRFLSGRGIPCLDITEDLARAARERGERLYYWLDIHWTAAGNAVAAEAVARALESGRLVPEPSGAAAARPERARTAR